MTLDDRPTRLATLTTDRLSIRPISTEGAEELHAVKSDPVVTRAYGQEPHRSVEDTRAWIRRALADQERSESAVWAISLLETGTVVGECCFWNIKPKHRCAEIGFEIHPSQWRKGITAEAISALLTYGFADLGLHKVEANPLAANRPSQNLLRKLGFRQREARQGSPLTAHCVDQVRLELLKEDWMMRTTGA